MNEWHIPAFRKRTLITRKESGTDPSHGRDPSKRGIGELLDAGFIILDKPIGPTSHQVSAWVKDIFGLDKAGHAGTLDPNVSGVLVVALGRATKIQKVLLEGGKEYVGLVRYSRPVKIQKAREIFSRFTGKVFQTPPLQAAVARRLRIREIYYNEVLEVKKDLVLFRSGCESGTYMRVLAVDTGRAMGLKGELVELRRTISSRFTEDMAVTLQDVKDAFVEYRENGDEGPLREIVRPVEEIFDHVARIYVNDPAVDALCHGADLALPGVCRLTSGIERGSVVGVLTLKGELIGWGKALMSTDEMTNGKEGIAVNLGSIMMETGTYPRMWKHTSRVFEGE